MAPKWALALALGIVARHSLGRTPALSMRGPPALGARARTFAGLGLCRRFARRGPGPLHLRPLSGMGAVCVGPRLCPAPVLALRGPGALSIVMSAASALRTCRSAALPVSGPGVLCARVAALYVSGPSPSPLYALGAYSILGPGGLFPGPLWIESRRSPTHPARGPPTQSRMPPIRGLKNRFRRIAPPITCYQMVAIESIE